MTAWLLFYGGLLLLVVRAKHVRAEMLNSNSFYWKNDNVRKDLDL